MLRRLRLWGILLAILAFLSTGTDERADAHPHVWIDLGTRLVFDGDGRVEGVEIAWLFDSFYTAYTFEAYMIDGSLDDRKVDEMVAGSMQNLRAYDYFADIRVDGAKVPFDDVERYEAGIIDGRLWVRFVVPLAEPVDPALGRLSYAIYDPTYYIDIAYRDPASANLKETAAESGCDASLEEANPTSEAITLAQSLDRMQTGPATLGEMFAQRVRLECR